MKQKVEQLTEILGKNETNELLKLCKNFDNYIKKYKDKVNDILGPHGYQVLLAHSFVTSEQKDEILKSKE